jgi:hypothetical protein
MRLNLETGGGRRQHLPMLERPLDNTGNQIFTRNSTSRAQDLRCAALLIDWALHDPSQYAFNDIFPIRWLTPGVIDPDSPPGAFFVWEIFMKRVVEPRGELRR